MCNAAEIRKDERILLELLPGPGQPDLIAREVQYHRNCYADYTHVRTLSKMLETQQCEEEAKGGTAYDKAFLHLAKVV